uniref:Uncharacterized protein n=1 Tax=Strigamia maritima TaxID=126957 RepID=T1IU85_STRMM
MAQPMTPNVPAICLCLFVNLRLLMKTTIDECSANNITIAGFSSDGDPKLLRSMQLSSGLFCKPMTEFQKDNCSYNKFYNKFYGNKITSSKHKWFVMNGANYFQSIQDTIHIGAKLRSRLLKNNFVMPIGRYFISVLHLQYVVDNYAKDLHPLQFSDLDGRDKINYAAVERMMSHNVLEREREREVGGGVWRLWLKNSTANKLIDSFITTNAYQCIELNGHGIIRIIENYRENSLPFMPQLIGSQQCEQLFRIARSYTVTNLTNVNFNVKKFIQKIYRIEAELANSIIKIPKFRKHSSKMGGGCSTNLNTVLPKKEEILECILRAQREAMATTSVLIGMALLKRGSRDCEDGASTRYNSMNTDEVLPAVVLRQTKILKIKPTRTGHLGSTQTLSCPQRCPVHRGTLRGPDKSLLSHPQKF